MRMPIAVAILAAVIGFVYISSREAKLEQYAATEINLAADERVESVQKTSARPSVKKAPRRVEAVSSLRLEAVPAKGTAPLTVIFTLSPASLGYHSIDFGDGESAAQKCAEYVSQSDACIRSELVQHTYVKPGTYTAQYIGENEDGFVAGVVITVE